MDNQPTISFSEEFSQLMGESQKVRLADKTVINIFEAAAYTGIGINRLAKLEKVKNCDFIIYRGAERLFIRKKLATYLEKQYAI